MDTDPASDATGKTRFFLCPYLVIPTYINTMAFLATRGWVITPHFHPAPVPRMTENQYFSMTPGDLARCQALHNENQAVGGQMAERLGSQAINQKVAGSVPDRAK